MTSDNQIQNDGLTRLGVIGLGAMGTPMTRNLLTGDVPVGITSSRPQDALIEAGAKWYDTPREMGRECSTVLVMVPDLPELKQVLEGPDGLLSEAGDLLILVGSTSSPIEVRNLDAELRQASEGRVRLVDCPVSGGVEGAGAGTLSIMVGGSEEDAAIAVELLRPCGIPIHLGPLGAGQVAKACNQMVVGATMLALGEASVLAARSGIDLQQMWDLLGGGYAGSNLLEVKKHMLVSGDYTPGGMAKYMLKDLAFADDIATATETEASLLPTLQEVYSDLVKSGYGDQDLAVVAKYLEDRA